MEQNTKLGMPKNKIPSRSKPRHTAMDNGGEEVIVLANMNKDVLAKDIAQFCKDTNLVKAISSVHGKAPIPTHQRGSRAIDGIFLSKTLLIDAKGGFLVFGKAMVSDHCVIWIDIPAANLGMDQAQDISRPAGR